MSVLFAHWGWEAEGPAFALAFVHSCRHPDPEGKDPEELDAATCGQDLSADTLNNLTIPFPHAGVLMTLADHTCGGAAATMVL